MSKTQPLGFRVEPEIKAALEKAADKDGRSVSNLIERILEAWLVDHGHLASAADRAWREGREAFLADTSAKSGKNPYRAGSEKHDAWESGWSSEAAKGYTG